MPAAKVNKLPYDRSKPWIKRVFSGKNGIILALTAAAFLALNIYRLNDPLPVGSHIPDFTLTSPYGNSFKISEIKTPAVLVFYKKHGLFSNYMFNRAYRKMLPELELLQDKNYAQVIVLTDGMDTAEKVAELARDKNHETLKNIGYAADTGKIAKMFGIRSWPHIFVINGSGKVIYQSKLAGADHIQKILWRD